MVGNAGSKNPQRCLSTGARRVGREASSRTGQTLRRGTSTQLSDGQTLRRGTSTQLVSSRNVPSFTTQSSSRLFMLNKEQLSTRLEPTVYGASCTHTLSATTSGARHKDTIPGSTLRRRTRTRSLTRSRPRSPPPAARAIQQLSRPRLSLPRQRPIRHRVAARPLWWCPSLRGGTSSDLIVQRRAQTYRPSHTSFLRSSETHPL